MNIAKKIAATDPVERIKPKRIWELDFIRGFCVTMMILDHLLFDLGFVFLHQWFGDADTGGLIYSLCHFARYVYWDHPLRLIIRTLILAGFIGSCGISCSLSRSNLKRGLKLLFVALALSAITAILDMIIDSQRFFISFGILHMLAISILVYAGLRRFGMLPALILGAAIVLAGWLIQPELANSDSVVLFILGLSDNGFSADYFPLIPYLGWFLLGGALGGRLYKEKRSFFPNKGQSRAIRPFLWLGRHALLIYVLHQPVIYGFLLILGMIFGR
jgi:uncharacterized membrane protein